MWPPVDKQNCWEVLHGATNWFRIGDLRHKHVDSYVKEVRDDFEIDLDWSVDEDHQWILLG